MKEIHNSASNQQKLKDSRILIVEDNYLSLLFLQKVFEPYECSTIHAKNGKEAIDLILNGSSFDIVMLDLNMPIMNGYDTVTEIRKIDSEVPIIALTGNVKLLDDDELVKEFNDYLTKPITEGELLQAISKYLSIHKN